MAKVEFFSGFGGGGGVLLGGATEFFGVWWGFFVGGAAPCRVEKNFFKKKKFFCGALCLKKKSWAFSFKRAASLISTQSFFKKVFCPCRNFLRGFCAPCGVAAFALPAERIVFSGCCAKMRPPENSGYSGSGFSAKMCFLRK